MSQTRPESALIRAVVMQIFMARRGDREFDGVLDHVLAGG
jgi:hypothetical protein